MQTFNNFKEREQKARNAIWQSYLQDVGLDNQVRLYVEHHLQEISPQYWQHHTGLTRPGAKQVIELLSTQRFLDFHSVEENDDSIDFSLPENVTDYVLCVSFDEDGNVEDISMES